MAGTSKKIITNQDFLRFRVISKLLEDEIRRGFVANLFYSLYKLNGLIISFSNQRHNIASDTDALEACR